MTPGSSKSRRPRRSRPVPAADPLRRLLVKHDERGNPVCDDRGRPIFWVIDEGGQLRRLVFPIQPDDEDDKRRQRRPFGAGGGPPDDLPAPLKITTGRRGQPPKTPAGTFEDHADLFETIEGILGDADDRADRLTEIHTALCRLAREFLGPERFAENECEKVLKSLARRTITKKIGSDEIERQLLVWRYGLTDPAVRKARLPRKPKPLAHDFTALVLKYESYEPFLDAEGKPATYEDGRRILVPAAQPRLAADGKPTRDNDGRPVLVRRPVCDHDGRPILWVPDEHGQPSRPYGVLDEEGQLRPYVAGEPRLRRTVQIIPPPSKRTFR